MLSNSNSSQNLEMYSIKTQAVHLHKTGSAYFHHCQGVFACSLPLLSPSIQHSLKKSEAELDSACNESVETCMENCVFDAQVSFWGIDNIFCM